jgi:gas vesicle protein
MGKTHEKVIARKGVVMGSFTNGVLVGVGISLLFAPQTGEETRRFLRERWRSVRGIPPENEELQEQMQQMTQRVQQVQRQATQAAQMGSTVQHYAQETAEGANTVQRDLKDIAKQAGAGQQNPPGRQGQ